jgi:uncharacterized protein YndB with AHSA1/START domain
MTKTIFEKDIANKSMHIERSFDAPLPAVWKSWTDSSLLDLWWAPKPYRAVTKTMNFKNEGEWIYYMLGPEGDKTYCKASYSNIIPMKSYEAVDAFCDENGVATEAFPNMHWTVFFHDKGDTTLVTVDISYDSVESMEKIIEMGFQEGFSMAHDNLDEVLLTSE